MYTTMMLLARLLGRPAAGGTRPFATTSLTAFLRPTPHFLAASQSHKGTKPPQPPINDKIKSPVISFVDLDGALQGERRLAEVLASFDPKVYSLVQVDGTTRPPVCRLMDRRTMRERAKRQQQAQRRSQALSTPQELLVSSLITPYDLQFKVKNGLRILSKGRPLKVSIVNKARKGASNSSRPLAKTIIDAMAEAATLQGDISVEGPYMRFLLKSRSKPT
ncbi:hypothetical protein H4R34_000234 [Dimargaris verticillata]|uniref:Translation initiation factor 3 N-terminal domain-containing protein n=1 Tax=Dimargaris verticillata TaxID=2761393 RepID=A0A9W8BDM9_9FUNG|nr:hypothetical protein H4R34_000234 [Dimargaris verticillata]